MRQAVDKWPKSDSLHNTCQYEEQANRTEGGGPLSASFGKASLPQMADLPAHIRKSLFFQAEDAAWALTGQ